MDQQMLQIELIRGAQRGNKQCLEQLARQAKDRLHTYVYRLTQREELTQEIVQESLVEMFKVIGKLRKEDRFWPWLYGIATNKLRRHYRTEQTQRRVAISSVRKRTPKDRQDGFENLVSEELKQIVSGAMKKLRTRHKAVLVMRCYDDMPYSQIAETMGCSEFSTRMLFMRAKRALQKELSRNGFGKGSLIAALVLFGKITAPSKAAAAQVSVSAATLKVGMLASIAGIASTKTAVVSLATASVITAGTITVTSGPWLHDQADSAASTANTQYIGQLDQFSNADQEYMYYFPQDTTGAMMLRATSGSMDNQPSRQILQNGQANYSYDGDSVYINNYRLWNSDLDVMKIPTDDNQFTNFICKVESSIADVKHIEAYGKRLLVIASRTEGQDSDRPWALRHYNLLDEDFFQSNWPTTARIVDNRDPMHQRGWTYFRIMGQINGQPVSGTGRIPFVYQTSIKYSPWLRLQVGTKTILDTNEQAYIYSSEDNQLQVYKGGSFFKGLTRPWMGLHTIDTVRRDAAEKRIWFETKRQSDSQFVQVELLCENLRLVYTIDMETDVVDEISFLTDQGNIGSLKFSYLQSIEDTEDTDGQFESPDRPVGRTSVSQAEPGLLWLTQLVGDSLE